MFAKYLERGFEGEALAGCVPGVLRVLPDAIEAFVAVGRLEEARQLVDELEAQGVRLDRPCALATGARCRGLVEAACGDLDGAQKSLERALGEPASTGRWV